MWPYDDIEYQQKRIHQAKSHQKEVLLSLLALFVEK